MCAWCFDQVSWFAADVVEFSKTIQTDFMTSPHLQWKYFEIYVEIPNISCFVWGKSMHASLGMNIIESNGLSCFPCTDAQCPITAVKIWTTYASWRMFTMSALLFSKACFIYSPTQK